MNIKKTLALLLALVLALTLCACGSKPSDETTAPPESAEATVPTEPTESTEPTAPTVENTGNFTFTKENYPRMGGSLANKPLGQAITATVLQIPREEADTLIKFEGSTTDNYKALIDGTFDILLAYEPSEEAKAYIAAHEDLEMTPIGVDALVFICSKENPVDSLSLKQIKSIYSGETTNWKDVGGTDGEIVAYQRNPDSGSQTLFDKLVNLGDKLMEAPTERQIGTMIGLLEAIAGYDDDNTGALGYTVYYYLTNMEKDKLDTTKILALDGVTPGNETIGDGSYTLTNDFYVVIRKSAPENSPERILYNWIAGPQGQQLVLQENYPVRTADAEN